MADQSIKVRYATLEDSKHVYEWRNDEVTRSMSANTDIVEYLSFDIIVSEILVIINRPAIIAVNLVKKLLADLEDI